MSLGKLNKWSGYWFSVSPEAGRQYLLLAVHSGFVVVSQWSLVNKIKSGRDVWVTVAGHLSLPRYGGVGPRVRMPLQWIICIASAYLATLLESWTAAVRDRGAIVILHGGHIITPVSSAEGCSDKVQFCPHCWAAFGLAVFGGHKQTFPFGCLTLFSFDWLASTEAGMKCLHLKQVEQILICLKWALLLNVKLTFSKEIYLIVLSEDLL